MGGTKRLIEKLEAQADAAIDIAVQAGVLTRCEFHGEVYGYGNDIVPAYKLGVFKFNRGELGSEFNSTPEVTAAIKRVVEGAAMECGTCAKWRNED